MRTKLIIATMMFLGIFGFVKNSQANISLPFFSDFNCAEQSGSSAGDWNCDGVTNYGAHYSCGGHYSQITSDANHPGSAGRGARQWLCGNDYETLLFQYQFASQSLNEVYVGFWVRYGAGFNFSNYHKLVYFHSEVNNNSCFDTLPWGFSVTNVGAGSTQVINSTSGGGFDYYWGGSPSNGSWHYVEVHIKAETTISPPNGVADMWVDGTQIMHDTGVNHGLLGHHIASFDLFHNARADGTSGYVDADDVSVRNSYIPYPGTGGGGGDTTPPVISNGSPSGALAAGTTQKTLSVTTNKNATCHYSAYANIDYNSMSPFTSTGGTTHTLTVSGLTNGTSYNYYVKCQDVNGYTNSTDYAITFSVAAGATTAPTISNVAGSIQTGQTITVNGTNMANDQTGNWYWTESQAGYESGESFSDTANSDGWMSRASASSLNYITSGVLMGSRSLHIYDNVPCTTTDCGPVYVWRNLWSSGNPMYVSGYAKWHGSWPNNYQKFYLGGNAGIYFQPALDGYKPLDSNGNPTAFYIGHPEGGGRAYNLYTSTIDVSQDVWHYWEFSSAAGASSDTWNIWWDGKLVATGAIAHMDGATLYYDYPKFGIVNWAGAPGNPSTVMEQWQDRTVMSSSRIYPASTIEVGNSPDYSTATKKWQSPIHLSDGSVQFKLNLAGLGSGPYYLWVTNNKQERSAAYVLTSSGSFSDTTPPTISGGNPSGSLSSGTTQATLSVNTNEAATCRYYTVANTTYAGMANYPFTTTGGTNHSVTLTGLTSGRSYAYYVRCQDTAGNANPTDYAITFSVAQAASTCTSFTYSTWGACQSNNTQTRTVTASSPSGCTGGSPVLAQSCVPTSSDPSSATLLLSEGFENNSWSSRGWYDNTSGTVSTSEHQVGSGSLQAHYTQGLSVPWGAGAMRHAITPTDTLYISYWQKYSSTWKEQNGGFGHHEVLFLTDSDVAYTNLAFTHLTGYLETWGTYNQAVAVKPEMSFQDGANVDQTKINVDLTNTTENRGANGCNGASDSYTTECYDPGSGTYWNGKMIPGTPSSFGLNAWHHVEAYVKLNTISGGKGIANGIVTYWLDGVQQFSHNNVMMRTNANPNMKFNQFVIAPYLGNGAPGTQDIYYDNLEVWNGNPNTSSGTQTPTCTSFTYSAWGTCQPNSTQIRTLTGQAPSGCTGGTPVLTQSCTYVPPTTTCTSFTYTAWSACSSNSTQTRTVTASLPSGCTGGSPILTQTCTYVPPTTTCTSFTYSNWGTCSSAGTQTRTITAKTPTNCTGGTPAVLTQSCTYVPPTTTCSSFTYTAWSACNSSSVQARNVVTSSPTGCTGGTPVLFQACTYVPTCTSFTYSNWGTCSSVGTQTRTITAKTPANCTGGTPEALTQSCTYTPTCSSFTYTAWSACNSSSVQSRNVATSLPTGCTGGTPLLFQHCTYYPACTGFTYGSWSACQSDSRQYRTITAKTPANCTGGTPVLTQSCTYTGGNTINNPAPVVPKLSTTACAISPNGGNFFDPTTITITCGASTTAASYQWGKATSTNFSGQTTTTVYPADKTATLTVRYQYYTLNYLHQLVVRYGTIYRTFTANQNYCQVSPNGGTFAKDTDITINCGHHVISGTYQWGLGPATAFANSAATTYQANQNKVLTITFTYQYPYGTTIRTGTSKFTKSFYLRRCTDTESGQAYSFPGIATYTQNLTTKTYTDTCSGSTIVEYYCDANNYPRAAYYRCPYGCAAGACRTAPVSN